jgi:serine/threonine protein phosphatase PrpC
VTRLRAGAATDVGLARPNNQDQFVLASPIFAVADGMGGHAAGEVASQTAVEALRRAFGAAGASPQAVVEAMRAANRAVWERAQAHAELRGMGTTLTAVALVDDDGAEAMAVVNVGDSRTYRLRNGALDQVTVDHSYVAELVANGQIDEAEAEVHPQRHVLTRALGVAPDVAVDLRVQPPVAGDRYLLCSDGLSREVTDAQIGSTLRRLADPAEAARELVAEAKLHGGSDNITVVVVDVLADEAGPDGADDGAPTLALPTVGSTDGPVGDGGPAGRGGEGPSIGAGGPDGGSPADGTDDRRPLVDLTAAVSRAVLAGPPQTELTGQHDLGPRVTGVAATPVGPVAPPGGAVGPSAPLAGPPGASAGRPATTAAPAPPVGRTAASGPAPASRLATSAGSVAAAGPASPVALATAAPPAPAAGPRVRRRRRDKVPRARLITVRVVGFVLLLVAVLFVAAVGTEYYARSAYFVGLRARQLTIFQGRPGGVLWWKPTIAQNTGVTTSDVEPYHLAALRAGVQESSMGAARTYVSNLRAEMGATAPVAPPTPTTTATATAATGTTTHAATTHAATTHAATTHAATTDAATTDALTSAARTITATVPVTR